MSLPGGAGSLLKLVEESGGELTQEILILFLNFARNYAQGIKVDERQHGMFAGSLQLQLTEAVLPSTGKVCVEFEVLKVALRSNLASPSANNNNDNNSNHKFQWTPDRGKLPLVDVRNKDKTTVLLEMKILDNTAGTLLGFAAVGGPAPNTLKFDFSEGVHTISVPIIKDKDEPDHPLEGASLTFQYEFIPWWKAEHRGFVYSADLPVLSPDVELPIAAEPNHAFVVQDTMMKEAMGAIMYYWKAFGAESAMSVIPQRLSTRIDWANSDEFFANRRMNGFNPQFWSPVPGSANMYQINWDFSYLSPNDINTDALWFKYMRAVFTSVQVSNNPHGKIRLVPAEIQWKVDDTEYRAVPGDPLWERAKTLYKYVEVNLVYNWTHVGVHFDVEQYAMAVYRNLTPANPLFNFLDAHFDNIIYNDREVIRPTPDGAVSMAGALTFSGQMKMVIERFKDLTFKWNTPPRVLPDGIVDNVFDPVSDTFWKLLWDYTADFLKTQGQEIITTYKDELQAMANDLESHALNKPGMKIDLNNPLPDLQQMCTYTIYQAIFYHDWVHWNSWDDFHQSLYFRDDAKTVTPDQQAYMIDVSNRTQAFITYTSPTLRQWPVLDPVLGGPQQLRTALMKHAKQLNRQLLIGTYIMAPNT